MARIETYKYSIEQAFRECFYIIPAYQREYVWTDKEVNQLLEDINDQFENDSNQEYFIGMVLVAKKLDSSNLYEVIDGQQRLTTLFLLVCAFWHLFQEQEYQEQGDQKDTGKRAQHLRHLLSDSYTNADGAVKDNLKLELCYENTSEIMERLLDREAVLSENVRFGAPQNLVKAYKIVYDYLKDNYDDKGKFWGYLSNKVVFIQIATDVSHALKIFETINDRGIGLNPM
ncbi:MAG: DUF262 domain-containing protein, partial [Acetobacter sp.]|nr:DUF262 domain-containing protein [Acetobacter sp.]